MSNTLVKGIALATAVSVGALTLASPAEAGRRHHRHHHRGHHGGAAAAAIIGLGAAAIIAGSRRSHGYYDYGYQPRYYTPPRRPYYAYSGPAYGYAPAPWTPAWYRYCSQKYRSFDPRSGTFQPYYGPRRLCR
jgi:hypothetical protein